MIAPYLLLLWLAPGFPTVEMTSPVQQTATLTVRWQKGSAAILKVERRARIKPTRLPRWRGRFEARALAKGKPIEFVRFDFPLMAPAEAPDDTTAAARQVGRQLREHVSATTYVELALPPRASEVAIYDRVTRRQVVAPLPESAPAADAAENRGKSPER